MANFHKSYGPKPVERFDVAPVVTTDTRSTWYDGNSDDRLVNTALSKLRFGILKRSGKEAFRRSFKRR